MIRRIILFENLNFIINEKDLDDNELSKISSFIRLLSKSKYKIIYRGENYENLKNKFNLNGDHDYIKLNQFLFLLGDKGKTYRKE